MSILENIGRFLTNTVGNGQTNLPADLKSTKQHLYEHNYLNDIEPDNAEDFITRPLDTAIRQFQKDKHLRVDGILKPNGETEKALAETPATTTQQINALTDNTRDIDDAIGFGGNVSGTLAQASDSSQKPRPEQKTIFSEEPPAEKAALFKGRRREEWDHFNSRVKEDETLSPSLKHAMRTFFAMEGGYQKDASEPNGTTFAGLRKTYINGDVRETIEADNPYLMKSEAQYLYDKYNGDITPTKMDKEDILVGYKVMLARAMAGAAKGQRKNAIELIGDIKSSKIQSIIIDTILNHGFKKGVQMLQEALDPEQNKANNDGIFGSKTYIKLKNLSNTGDEVTKFSGNLYKIRISDPQKHTGDKTRYEYHR